MIIAELIIPIRTDYLDDVSDSDNPNKNQIADDKFMLRSFTEAQRQACNRTDFVFEELTITLIDGVSSYTLNPRITRIINVLFEGLEVVKTSQEANDYKTPLWRDETAMTGKDCRYFIRGNKLRVIPAPVTADAGLAVTIEAYVLPDDVFRSVQEEPVIPEEFHADLKWWVLYEALSKRDEDRFSIKAIDYLNKFEAVFGKYVSAQVRQHQLENGLPLVAQPQNYNNTASRYINEDNW